MHLTRRAFGRFALNAAASTSALALMPSIAAAETSVSHGISVFGGLKYAADFPHFDYSDISAPKGGTFSTGLGGFTFDSLHAYVLKGNSELFMRDPSFPYYDTLLLASGDEADAGYGLLARTIETPGDRTWCAFEMRAEARFADGSPVTAEDVVFSFEMLRDQGRPSYRVILKDVIEARAEGPHRVRFTFDEEAPTRRLPLLIGGLPIFSKAYWATRDFTESTLEPPLTSGPFEIESVQAGRQIVFRRREDYWARDLPVMKGRWNFDRYRVEYFRDRSADFEAFKAGVYNFREEFWSKLWATAYEPDEFPAVARGEVVRDTIPDDLPSGTQAYWINMRREKFQDIRVRRAIGLAFDFEWSNRTLFYGLYKRTDSIFEGGPMQAGAEPTPGERAILEGLGPELLATLPEGFIDQPAVSPPQTDGSGRLRRELREAAKLLDEAGWTIQDGVRKNAAGETLSIDFLESSPSFERITAPYVQNLQRLGIDATLRLIDASQAEKREDEFDYDITTGRFAMGLTPGTAMRDIFHSATAMANGSSNKSGVANPAIDRLVEMASAAETREELTDTVKALDRALRSLHIWVPQWHKGAHNLAFWDIYARPALKPKYERGVIDLWWVDREKAQRLDDKIET